MNENTDTKVKMFWQMDDEDIDYSDIPELTDEYLLHCLVRFRNKPIGQGGEWHKSEVKGKMSDERLEELKARARAEWEERQQQLEAGQLAVDTEDAVREAVLAL